MERAGRIITRLKTARKHFTLEELVRAAWPAAVGKKLAVRTRAAVLKRDVLVVEVEDDLWRRNLGGLRHQILKNLAELLDEAAPREIEFRVAPPRRLPQREHSLEGFSLTAPRVPDEADAIADPVLRRIYINSRRKALVS